MSEAVLRFDAVDFGYDGVPVLHRIDLEIPAGTLTAVMGPSGCGKSTLIALAAGLLAPDAGQVQRRSQRLGIVFQDPALLPWRTALDNVAFALIAFGLPRAERRARARDRLAAVGLTAEDIDKYPRQLSGGMRQRVALARALVIEPDLLLCDEPFSALDALVANDLRQRLRQIHDRTGLTTVIVTHDGNEAVQCDRVVIMSKGRIEQSGPPADIGARPASDFVRAFTRACRIGQDGDWARRAVGSADK
jgi:ABC-type sulfate/molybdate transport systems ATPase subunit